MDPESNVYEHRLVLHEAGIDIQPGYVVHHENEDRSDNRRENLRVISRADHNRLHLRRAGKKRPGPGAASAGCWR